VIMNTKKEFQEILENIVKAHMSIKT